VKDLANAGSPWNWNPNARQALEQVNMVKKGSTEPLGGAWVLCDDIVENDF
jgi:hypothetical protein